MCSTTFDLSKFFGSQYKSLLPVLRGVGVGEGGGVLKRFYGQPAAVKNYSIYKHMLVKFEGLLDIWVEG
jgi:hypothetical protein